MFNVFKKKETKEAEGSRPPTLPKKQSGPAPSGTPPPNASGGGFFNLPKENKSNPGGDLFKGMSLKTETSTDTGSSSGDMFSGMQLGNTNVTNSTTPVVTDDSPSNGGGEGGFDFVMDSSTTDLGAGGESSGFNFVSNDEIVESGDTGFNFLSSGVEEEVVPEIGFDFSSSNNNIVKETIDEYPVVDNLVDTSFTTTVTSTSSMAFPLSSSSFNDVMKPTTTTIYEPPTNIVVEVSKVKKKKSSKRPGYMATGNTTTGGGDEEKDGADEEKPMSVDTRKTNNRSPSPPPSTTQTPSISVPVTVPVTKIAMVQNDTPVNKVSSSITTPSVSATFSSTSNTPPVNTNSSPPATKKPIGVASPTVEVIKSQNNKEDSLTASLSDFNKQAAEISDQLLSLKSNRKTVILQKKAEEDLLLANENALVDLEKRQQNAIENEDYDKAESLNSEIEAIKEKIFAGRSSLLSLTKQVNNLKTLKQSIIDEQLKMVNQTSMVLNQISDKSASELAITKKKFSTEEQDETLQITKMTTRIDVKNKHLIRDEENAQNDRDELEKKIAEETGGFLDQIADVDANLLSLESEVAQLKSVLAKKEAEIREIEEEKRNINDKVTNIRKNFATELESINATESVVQEERKNLDALQEEVKQRSERMAKRKEENAKEISNKIDYLNSFKHQLKIAAILQDALKGQLSFERATSTPSSPSGKGNDNVEKVIADLKDQVSILQSSIRIIEGQLSSLEEGYILSINEVSVLDSKLPALEAEKKTAVATKNFKDAARINKDIQSINEDKSKATKKLEEISLEKKQAAAQLEDRRVKLLQSQNKLNEYEIASDKLTIEMLRGSIAKLKMAVMKMKTCVPPSLSTPSKNSFSNVASSLLDIELLDQNAQLSALCSKHNLMDLANVEIQADFVINDEKENPVISISRPHTPIHEEEKKEEEGNKIHENNNDVNLDGLTIDGFKEEIAFMNEELEKAIQNEEFEKCSELEEKIKDNNTKLELLIKKKGVEHQEVAVNNDKEKENEVLNVVNVEVVMEKIAIIDSDIKKMEIEMEEKIKEELYDDCDAIQAKIDDLKSEQQLLQESIKDISFSNKEKEVDVIERENEGGEEGEKVDEEVKEKEEGGFNFSVDEINSEEEIGFTVMTDD